MHQNFEILSKDAILNSTAISQSYQHALAWWNCQAMLGNQLRRYRAVRSTTINQSNCSYRELRTILTTYPIPLWRHSGLPKCNWIGLRPFSTLGILPLHLHWQTQQMRRRGNGGNTTSEHGWWGRFRIQTSTLVTLPNSFCASLNMGLLGQYM